MNKRDDKKKEETQKQSYSDQEINDLAEWLDDLTLKQAFFIKASYEGLLKDYATECGSLHVH